MVHEVRYGKTTRMSYSRIKEVLDIPDLLEVQKKSYQRFLEHDFREVLADFSPIKDFSDNLILEFIDYHIEDKPKYSVEECKERDANYAAPLKVKVRLTIKNQGAVVDIKEQEVFMGDFPLMTDTGTFIINGAERVVVSQLVRSPGVYYSVNKDKSGKNTYAAQAIPNRGAWLEYEIDSNDVFWVKVDRTRKLPVTVLLRALGLGTDEEILEHIGDDERIRATIEKDSSKTFEQGQEELYKRLRPGETATSESVNTLLNSMFFDDKRYDLARVGRYKYNKKLSIAARIAERIAAEDIINPETGELMIEKGKFITREKAKEIENAGINSVYVSVILKDENNNNVEKVVKVVGNNFVDAKSFLPFDPKEVGILEKVHYPTLKEILNRGLDEQALKVELKNNLFKLVPKHIYLDDIIASINYALCLYSGIGHVDDIDHLGNRRIRSVGELLQNQIRIGLSRLERVVRERMGIQDLSTVTPMSLINIRPVTAAIKEFFGSSQLSQFMDQNNPL
ncbi:MAG TPA: DNA-directed RNA polymerase subunit beta, partial [Clostridia bacterium]|nr:DNA-directed RNA polymerase subunit beta [Clostridia bacterium]